MIKRLLVSGLLIACLCCGCVNGDATNTTTAATETATQTATQTATEAATPTGLSEAKLLEIMQKACGSDFESYIYTDMDKDGSNELIGAFATNFIYQTWYCSSDGKICEKVHENTVDFDACQIDIIEHENATHAAINTYNLIGTYKTFSILALQDSQINCLVSNASGYAGMDELGNPCVTIEGYDALWDNATGTNIGHTWKTTYIEFDENTNSYLEIPANEISEAEFLKFTNGREALDTIKSEEHLDNPVKVEYGFFLRSNGFVHVQCNSYDSANSISHHYHTMQYADNKLLNIPGTYSDGIMSVQMTGFEAAQ